MGVKKRITEYISYKKIPTSEFEKKCNLSNGYISSIRNGFGVQKLENVLNVFSDLRRDWLLYGEGEMLKSELSEIKYSQTIVESNIPNLHQEQLDKKDNQINTLQQEIKELNKQLQDINKQLGCLEGKLEVKDEVISIFKEELYLLKKDFQTPNVQGARCAAI